MDKVTQKEMHKAFSDYLAILKADFKSWADEYPEDVQKAYELAIKAYEVIADSDVGSGVFIRFQ